MYSIRPPFSSCTQVVCVYPSQLVYSNVSKTTCEISNFIFFVIYLVRCKPVELFGVHVESKAFCYAIIPTNTHTTAAIPANLIASMLFELSFVVVAAFFIYLQSFQIKRRRKLSFPFQFHVK